jgi:hypothetical protein
VNADRHMTIISISVAVTLIANAVTIVVLLVKGGCP